ncbi:zinc dependent phospholipase C family protein [Halobacillus amylolyticus]|uniref:Zinc dependent phospholipase C family protein n=1 Tax=Halobacillus amylolyticus TaxID=2932259 RepID=A0ABY4HG23_9BACI|nr:zinc dependent phospholipase C family protein [Halobacillus amylolyticus]UOR13233.1 zinc dependent phospholipase C family protein [Halobacillus amylolyticus]
MPNIWTHIMFAEDVCNEHKREDIINTSGRFLNMGAQGPDPFFYYNFWPRLSDHGVNEVGMKLHTEQCGAFLINMINRGKHVKNRSQAYILGFVSHHILDRVTHPYIHYYSGYQGHKHQELEVIIDTLMLDKYRQLKPWKTPVYKQVQLNKKEAKELARWLEQDIYTLFPELSSSVPSNYVVKSLMDIALAQRLLFDPNGWKNDVLGSMVSSFSHRPIKENFDYLNEHRKEWKHSATGKPSHASFIDLYETAFQQTCSIIELILSYWSSSEEGLIDPIRDQIGDISYDTGKPLSLRLKNHYAHPIV